MKVEDGGSKENQIDGKETLGHLEGNGKKKKKIEAAEKEVEGEKNRPERIDLKVGQVNQMVAGKKKNKGGENTAPVGFGEVSEEKKGGAEGQATVNKVGEIKDNNRRRSKSPKGEGKDSGGEKEVGIGESVVIRGKKCAPEKRSV